MVKSLDSTYAKAYLKHVDYKTTHMKSEARTLLLSLFEEFKEFFDGALRDWATDPVNIDLKPVF